MYRTEVLRVLRWLGLEGFKLGACRCEKMPMGFEETVQKGF